jgi:L-cystine uptake protein TcyP (sodium:dicarboxylate symporter family)
METPQGLDDPDYAAFAWGRYRRILGWMALASLATAILAVLILWHWLGWLNFTVAIATALGIFCTMLLGAALMGLMFLSSGTGHDEQVEDRISPEIEIGD